MLARFENIEERRTNFNYYLTTNKRFTFFKYIKNLKNVFKCIK